MLAILQEAELIHGRWAMLGVAGSLAVEVLGFGNWYDAPLWVSFAPAQNCACMACSLHVLLWVFQQQL